MVAETVGMRDDGNMGSACFSSGRTALACGAGDWRLEETDLERTGPQDTCAQTAQDHRGHTLLRCAALWCRRAQFDVAASKPARHSSAQVPFPPPQAQSIRLLCLLAGVLAGTTETGRVDEHVLRAWFLSAEVIFVSIMVHL